MHEAVGPSRRGFAGDRPSPVSSSSHPAALGSCGTKLVSLAVHPTPDEPGFAEAEQLYIDPEECIDCDACVEACPVDAITSEDRVPAEWAHYIETNAEYFRTVRSSGGRATS